MLAWSQGSKLTFPFLINCIKYAIKLVLLILPCQLFLITALVLRIIPKCSKLLTNVMAGGFLRLYSLVIT